MDRNPIIADSTVPITERSNSRTYNIDQADVRDMVRLFRECDKEIFSEFEGLPGLNNTSFIETVLMVANILSDVLKSRTTKTLVVLSGCGTSGRLAFLACRKFNEFLRTKGQRESFRYTLAGGDQALFTSVEHAEDDPLQGIADLQKIVEESMSPADPTCVLYIGITCGLSAPYVAGQLDHCLRHLDQYTPVLLGFNPVALARDTDIKNWNKTFKDVTVEMERNIGRAFILNPIIGPEPITGSSRMKGGTVTKLLLETVFILAQRDTKTEDDYRSILKLYEQTCEDLQSFCENDVSQIIEMAGKSLQSGGSIHYIGVGTTGIIALVDASECVPTFGADRNDVRGWVKNGYKGLENKEGNLSSLGEQCKIDWIDFVSMRKSRLSHKDMLIVLLVKGEDSDFEDFIWDCPAQVVFLYVGLDQDNFEMVDAAGRLCIVRLKAAFEGQQKDTFEGQQKDTFEGQQKDTFEGQQKDAFQGQQKDTFITQCLHEIAIKWTCNMISTGAHVLKGKVFHNLMIDVRISNVKLYYRALSIIQIVTGCDEGKARSAMNTTLFGCPGDKPVDVIIREATAATRVVPTCALMILSSCTRERAVDYLNLVPVVRNAIQAFSTF